MLPKFPISKRYHVLSYFAFWFVATSFLLRIVLLVWQYDEVSWHPTDLLRTLATGFFFDLGSIVFFCIAALLYFTFLPGKFTGGFFDRLVICFFTALAVFILVFAFFAEITFWEEFRTRFNFIAVDYLIYTHEVVANIEQSYPLPLLIGGVLLLTVLVLGLGWKMGVFAQTFASKPNWKQRFLVLATVGLTGLIYVVFVRNSQAEWSDNRYNSEISKSGIYSFFAAFRNNQMAYGEFYSSIANDKAFGIVRGKLQKNNSRFTRDSFSIHRKITHAPNPEMAGKNVVFILVESLSANFMKEFGNTGNITPFLDSLAQKSLFFSNLQATGTRTVRGMEAVTLCIPPTPGQSIVKRPDNANLYTISNVFANKGYTRNFFYGGDGYFDNMNAYFGGNGFTIYDRGRGSILNDAIKTTRHNIADSEVSFENAWGICDGDLYGKMLHVADAHYRLKQHFFNFVMTTSNHRPYTYPAHAIDIPSGTGREGAVKYTDYALRKMFEKARSRPWFSQTIFVIVADHCASSAGKDEIDVGNYHIPAFIANLPGPMNRKIGTQCSQIDLFPTLFAVMGWNYDSDFFGGNVLAQDFEPRAFIGTYRKLALIKKDRVLVLSDQKKQKAYRWSPAQNKLSPQPVDRPLFEETIAWYQTADYLFSNQLLK